MPDPQPSLPRPLPTVAELEESLRICEAAPQGPYGCRPSYALRAGIVFPRWDENHHDMEATAAFINEASTTLHIRTRQLLSLLPLLEYVQHKPGCASNWINCGEQCDCDCGLDTLKAALGIMSDDLKYKVAETRCPHCGTSFEPTRANRRISELESELEAANSNGQWLQDKCESLKALLKASYRQEDVMEVDGHVWDDESIASALAAVRQSVESPTQRRE